MNSKAQNKKSAADAHARAKIGRNAGIVGIGVNLLLFAVKLVAGILSGAVSIIADAINNLTDAASSILVIVGYVISSKPADHEHPYGHARMEYLCSLFISTIVTVLGIELFISSVESIVGGGEGATYSTLSIVIMGAAVIVKVGLAMFYSRVGKKIDSAALRASAADSIGDVCATLAVILGIVLTPVIGPATDGIFGALIAIYIFVMGVKLIIDASSTLIGTPPDIELIKAIVAKLKSYDGVLGIHDLVVHNYGVNTYFATVHVEMDADRDAVESHDLIDNIEVEVMEEMGIHLVIHYDPVAVNDERVNNLRASIHDIIDGMAAEFSSPISFHDFRVVFGHTHVNIIFDIAITHEFPLSNIEIVVMIRQSIKEKLGKKYNAVITVDRDYTTTRY